MMKTDRIISLIISFSIWLSSIVCLKAEDSTVDLMAARSIPYCLRLCELENDPKQSRVLVGKLAMDLFSYWYDSNKLGIAGSKKIDNMAQHAYAVSQKDFPTSILLKKSLNDPLDALENWEQNKLDQKWKFSNKQDYEASIKEFLKFLDPKK